ncbi:MAG: glutathione transferase GstA [Proteobacteria bacterium]|nr:glutathione transferase GstA [Pseudomonadota bacterium]
MKLYLTPGACSLSPHIVAQEAGIVLELKKVDLRTKKVSDGSNYNEVNPKGSVPLLVLDDGTKLTEGPVIVQYLADQKPQSGLMPAPGSIDRYRVLEWLNFEATELHKSFSPMFNPAAVPEWKQFAAAAIHRHFDYISKQLKDRQFLVGDRFTVADAYLFTILGWGQYAGIDVAKWPVLKSYVDRIAARPKVQAALQAEKALG